MGLYQTKKVLHSKRNNEQVKRQHTKWEKIFLMILELSGLHSIMKNT